METTLFYHAYSLILFSLQWMLCGKHGAHGLRARSVAATEGLVKGPEASIQEGMEQETDQ